MAAAVEPGVLERLVDRDGVPAEVLLVHVEDRVADRPAGAGRADRCERRAVLHDAALTAVVPDEVRDPVHVGVGAGGDRREADRASATGTSRRRGRSCRARRGRRAPASRRSRPRPRTPPASGRRSRPGRASCTRAASVSGEAAQPRVAVGPAPRARAASTGTRERLEEPDEGHQRERGEHERRRGRRTQPCRLSSRRAEGAAPRPRRADRADDASDRARDRLVPASNA